MAGVGLVSVSDAAFCAADPWRGACSGGSGRPFSWAGRPPSSSKPRAPAPLRGARMRRRRSGRCPSASTRSRGRKNTPRLAPRGRVQCLRWSRSAGRLEAVHESMLAPQPVRRRGINDVRQEKSAVRSNFCVRPSGRACFVGRRRFRSAEAGIRAPAAGVGSGGRGWVRARPRATPFRCAMAYGVGHPGSARAGVQADSNTRRPGSAGGARAGVRTWQRGRKGRRGKAGGLFGVSAEAIRRHAARRGWRRQKAPSRQDPAGRGQAVS
jgi:hypothetical protein